MAAVGFCDELRAEAGKPDSVGNTSKSKTSKAVAAGAGAKTTSTVPTTATGGEASCPRIPCRGDRGQAYPCDPLTGRTKSFG